jgi:hypothetical protein
MKRDSRAFLSDVIEAGNAIHQAIAGISLDDYRNSRLIRSAHPRVRHHQRSAGLGRHPEQPASTSQAVHPAPERSRSRDPLIMATAKAKEAEPAKGPHPVSSGFMPGALLDSAEFSSGEIFLGEEVNLGLHNKGAVWDYEQPQEGHRADKICIHQLLAIADACHRHHVARLHDFGWLLPSPLPPIVLAGAYFGLEQQRHNRLGLDVVLVMTSALRKPIVRADIETSKRLIYEA